MSHANIVSMSVSGTPGTGTVTLGSAIAGFQSFSAAYGANKTIPGVLFQDFSGATLTGQEVCENCVYDHAAGTITRGTRVSSSSGGALTLSSAAVVSVVPTAASGTRWDQHALTRVVGADADTTMLPNCVYVVDMSAWATADRTYTLPTTASIDDRSGLEIINGNATHELILKTGAGQTCAFGGSVVAAATEIARFSVAGETALVHYPASNAWATAPGGDGRIGDTISGLADGTVVADTDELIVLRAGENFRAKLYSEGTFTPGITFGGAAVGLTLSGATGLYLRIGEWCFFNLSVGLSAKGSSTGNMAITGLPFTPDSAVPAAGIAVRASALASTVGGIFGQWIGGSTTLAVAQSATGTAATLTDANCTNGSSFNISGFYKVA